MTVASFISSGTSHAILNGFAFFAFVVWLSLGYWTYKDARRRIEDPLLIGLSTLVALVIPFVGPFIYMLFRPPEYLDDVRERELEMQAAEARLAELGYHLCPHCDYEVEKDFLRCPNCLRKLKDACPSCAKPLDPNWRICPYCEAEVQPITATARRPPPRRRRPSPAAEPAEPTS